MSRTLKIRNPRTGKVDYKFEAADAEHINAQAAKLRSAQRQWEKRSLAERIEAMLAWADALEADRAVISAALEVDTGRRRIAGLEVDGVVASIRAWAAMAPGLMPEMPWVSGRSNPSIRHAPQYKPYELVGVISPWNFPLTLSLIDTIPALLAGGAVIIKPSEVTPRFVEPLQATIDRIEGLADVLFLAPGDGETGMALIDAVDLVCFTGSVPTGRKVAMQAAGRLIPAFLELGGKDPLIVTESADVALAVRAALRGSVLSTGQACQSIERVYVAKPIYTEFVQGLVEAAEAVSLNWPDISKGQIGPLIFDRQAETISSQIKEAQKKGARVLTGGKVEKHGGGRWVRPTVIVDVDHTMDIMREETFGPVIPVMAFETLEQAVDLANDTQFGLSAAVFAGSLEEAEAVGRKLEAGAVSLNDAALTALFHEAEKQSFKASGLGPSRMGAAGLTRFFRRKALIANAGEPAPLFAFSEEG